MNGAHPLGMALRGLLTGTWGELGGSQLPHLLAGGSTPSLDPGSELDSWLSQTLPVSFPLRGPGKTRGQDFWLLLTPDLYLPFLYLYFKDMPHYLSIRTKKAHNGSAPPGEVNPSFRQHEAMTDASIIF